MSLTRCFLWYVSNQMDAPEQRLFITLQTIMHFTRTIATTAFILVVISLSFPLFLVAIMPLTWFYLRVTV